MSEHSPEATRHAAYKLFEDYFSGSSKAEFNWYFDDLIKAGVWYDQPPGRRLISRHDLVRAALMHTDLLNNLHRKTAGFGLGLERLLMWVLQIAEIRCVHLIGRDDPAQHLL